MIRHTERPLEFVLVGMALANPAVALEVFRGLGPDGIADRNAEAVFRALKQGDHDKARYLLGVDGPANKGKTTAEAVLSVVRATARRKAIKRRLGELERAALVCGMSAADFLSYTQGALEHATSAKRSGEPVAGPEKPSSNGRLGGEQRPLPHTEPSQRG